MDYFAMDSLNRPEVGINSRFLNIGHRLAQNVALPKEEMTAFRTKLEKKYGWISESTLTRIPLSEIYEALPKGARKEVDEMATHYSADLTRHIQAETKVVKRDARFLSVFAGIMTGLISAFLLGRAMNLDRARRSRGKR